MSSTLSEIITTAFKQAGEEVTEALPKVKMAIVASANSEELIDELVNEALHIRLTNESAKVRIILKQPTILATDLGEPEVPKTPKQGRPRRNPESHQAYMAAFMDRWKVFGKALRLCTKLELIEARDDLLNKAHGLNLTAQFYQDIINNLPEDNSTPGEVFSDEQIVGIKDQIWTAEEVPVV